MATGAKKKWKLALRLAVLVALLALVASLVDLRGVGESLAVIPVWVVAVGLLLGIVRLLLIALRWGILDAAVMGDARLRRWDYVRYQLTNSTFNLFMPSVIGGDVARALLVAAETASHRVRRLLVILFDRVLGILSVAALGTVAGLVAPGLAHRGAYLSAVLTLDAILLAAVVVGSSRRLRGALSRGLTRLGRTGRWLELRVDDLGACFEAFRERPGRVLLALFVCLGVHASTFVLVVLSARALDITVPISTLVLVTTISWVIVLIPVSIGGLGLRELSFVAMLAPQGVSEEQATALSLFQFAVSVFVGLIGVPVVLMQRKEAEEA